MNNHNRSVPLILCIDDDADARSLLHYLLKPGGYEVLTAGEGRQGIQLATANQPDVILLDVKMPGLNGYEVCLQLQKDPVTAYIPVVFLTACKSEPDKKKAFAAGAADFLTKPFYLSSLLQKIQLQLERNAQWRQLRNYRQDEETQPSEFLQFKQFVARKLDFAPDKNSQWMKISAMQIYESACDFDIEHEDMAKLIAEFLKAPYVPHVRSQIIRIGVIPTAFSKSNHILAVDEAGCGVSFILSNPFDWTLLDTLKKFMGVNHLTRFAVTEPDTIAGIFDRSKRRKIPAMRSAALLDVHREPRMPRDTIRFQMRST